jgi:hypothetical protein
MSEDIKVEVRGIRELNRAFRAVDTDLSKELKSAFRAVAEHVVGIAQQRMPYKSGGAVKSVKPRASSTGAGIAFGGNAAPYEPWLDFGGSTGRGHKPKVAGSGAIKRPFIKEGRYVYPAISESKDYTMDEVGKAIDSIARGAGFEVKG